MNQNGDRWAFYELKARVGGSGGRGEDGEMTFLTLGTLCSLTLVNALAGVAEAHNYPIKGNASGLQ